jgi:hypothetical protein
MTRNELRKICELEEVKDKPMMDEFLIAQGLVPIDMAGMGGGMAPGEEDSLLGGVPPNQQPEDPDLTHRFKEDAPKEPKPKEQVDDNLRRDKEDQ